MGTNVYPFKKSIPFEALQEISLLVEDGYVVHKEWANGVELRKGKTFRVWLLAFHLLLLPVLLFPGVIRSIVDNFFGYKHRVFVRCDEAKCDIHFC